MAVYDSLKAIWKKLGVKGQVKNYSSKSIWVLETESGHPIARVLEPGFKSPTDVDIDGFKRVDGHAIEGHKNWWKFYDFSTVDIFDKNSSLRISVVSKVAVSEKHFGDSVIYKNEKWGQPIQLISDVKRDGKQRIIAYHVHGIGWLDFEEVLKMACHHQIDNARPVFPKNGRAYIRTKRDKSILNNISIKKRLT